MITKLALTVPEAAEATGISQTSLKRAIATGDLRARAMSVREDGRASKRVVLTSDLQAYLEALPDAP